MHYWYNLGHFLWHHFLFPLNTDKDFYHRDRDTGDGQGEDAESGGDQAITS